MNNKYPHEVLTTSKRGKVEVRSLIDQGRFVRYEYIDPESGEKTENKIKLVLVLEGGMEECFIIPTKDKRKLLIPVAAKGPRKIWDGKANQPVEL